VRSGLDLPFRDVKIGARDDISPSPQEQFAVAKDKQKQQKKKERERRVAKEKLAAAAKRKEQGQQADDAPKKTPKTFGATAGTPGVKPQSGGGKTTKQFTQRRAGGA
jgi:hypothetical protein